MKIIKLSQMNKRTFNRVNGGIVVYYGITSIIAAISCAIGIGVWLFKVFTHQKNFSWGTLIGLMVITAILGIIGYSILRVGHEEIENNVD
jgi:hypothetical protein